MASRKEHPYESLAEVTKITVTSRGSIKIKDSFWTVEYQEQREFFDDVLDDVDMDKEREIAWDIAHSEVEAQLEAIVESARKV